MPREGEHCNPDPFGWWEAEGNQQLPLIAARLPARLPARRAVSRSLHLSVSQPAGPPIHLFVRLPAAQSTMSWPPRCVRPCAPVCLYACPCVCAPARPCVYAALSLPLPRPVPDCLCPAVQPAAYSDGEANESPPPKTPRYKREFSAGPFSGSQAEASLLQTQGREPQAEPLVGFSTTVPAWPIRACRRGSWRGSWSGVVTWVVAWRWRRGPSRTLIIRPTPSSPPRRAVCWPARGARGRPRRPSCACSRTSRGSRSRRPSTRP